MDALRIDRDAFITTRFHYRPGEHVGFFGPTGDGKSTLAFELLDQVASPDLEVVNLVVKPRDAQVLRLSNAAGFKIVRTWPPARVPELFQTKPRGWTLWPKHNLKDLHGTNRRLYQEMRAALQDSYATPRKRILFCDEVMGLIELDPPNKNEPTIRELMEATWMRGRALDTGQWIATQQISYSPRKSYSQATHIFMSPDPDREARKRYAEIGGLDPKLILHNLERCDMYEFVYLRKKTQNSPAVICIVGA